MITMIKYIAIIVLRLNYCYFLMNKNVVSHSPPFETLALSHLVSWHIWVLKAKQSHFILGHEFTKQLLCF